MTLTVERPTETVPASPVGTELDALAAAIADVEGLPETAPQPIEAAKTELHNLVIINYSGELEKTWAAMLLASTAGAMGMQCKVFITFWGFQNVIKDSKRITGRNWMQKMMSVLQRPGISHRKLSKMDFLGMGPWMVYRLAKQYKDATPKELMEIAQSLGVEFIPCQMTMDLFGIQRTDLIDGMGEPVGAATVLGLIQEGWTPLFI
ncbi:MAG TPA: DsrE/DsrF/DrsH-like family protein [Candidatus Limnocylindrales bacterium]|nr:DsrE/DsrF/DrsH-like family protein [Candidatus Limnocylindrales bacterium]